MGNSSRDDVTGRSVNHLASFNRAESFGIWEAQCFARDSLKFEKRSQFFVGGDDESLSVVAVCISNEDRLSVGINRCDAAPTPTGFAEIVSDDFQNFTLIELCRF
jgi:hypothetical protein